MKLSCPHCGQPLDADEEWAGQAIECPACSQGFVIPRPEVAAALTPRAAPSRRPAAAAGNVPRPVKSYALPKPRGGFGVGKILLLLVVLAGAGFGYAMFQLKESPRQVWERIEMVLGRPASTRAKPAHIVAATPAPVPEIPPLLPTVSLPAAPPEPPPAPMVATPPPAVTPVPVVVASAAPPAPKPVFPTAGNLVPMTVSARLQTVPTLTQRRVTLLGNSELHVTGAGDPLAGSALNFTSPDAWLWLEKVRPSAVASTFLERMWVNGAPAALDTNVRVVQAEGGTVVIPHGPEFAAMTVFSGKGLTGSPLPLPSHGKYDTASLGALKPGVASFRLKRGYMATLAQQENGTGVSRNYVAQDHDLEVKTLPPGLDGQVHFVRIFPWRWVSKKGVAGGIWQNLNVGWFYDWNISQNSSPDLDYVPIRQKRGWPGLGQDWKARGSTHLLGYNEPDHKDQANLTVDEAIAGWPDLLATGLRLGAPAVSDGGLGWLFEFMEKADAAGLRVDFVPVHYYRATANPGDERGAAAQFYSFLKGIHDRVKRPLWVTEWNNGANWTKAPDPTYAQEKAAIGKMIEMLDKTPFVERYAIYNWVEDVRNVQRKDGSLTPAGEAYRDQVSPISYLQAKP